MQGFILKTADDIIIRFSYYKDDAPVTVEAFSRQLPYTCTLMHARVSGMEIWTDKAPALNTIQENASVFTGAGEVVIGPLKPARVKTAKCMGIYYGEGKGLDCCNIFARVLPEDLHLLEQLGEKIWKHGAMEVTFENAERVKTR